MRVSPTAVSTAAAAIAQRFEALGGGAPAAQSAELPGTEAQAAHPRLHSTGGM